MTWPFEHKVVKNKGNQDPGSLQSWAILSCCCSWGQVQLNSPLSVNGQSRTSCTRH